MCHPGIGVEGNALFRKAYSRLMIGTRCQSPGIDAEAYGVAVIELLGLSCTFPGRVD